MTRISQRIRLRHFIYNYNRITELLKDRVNLSNIDPVTHTIDWRVLSVNPNAISLLLLLILKL